MKRGPWQIVVALDLLLNAILGGSARQTLSARTGYALYRGKRWARVAAPIIDGLLFSRNHCTEQAREAGLIP
jgi:hypothetical protein